MEYSEELKKRIDMYPMYDTTADQFKELLEIVEMAYNEGRECGIEMVKEDPLEYIDLIDFAPEREH